MCFFFPPYRSGGAHSQQSRSNQPKKKIEKELAVSGLGVPETAVYRKQHTICGRLIDCEITV